MLFSWIFRIFAAINAIFLKKMNVLELSEQEIGRRQSLQELRNMGIDPYPAAEFPTNAFSTEIRENFKDDEEREVIIAGRMMSRRVMGKASFAELQDSKGPPKEESKFISPATTSVRARTRTYIIMYLSVCSTSATLSVSRVRCSVPRLVRSLYMLLS